MTSVRARQVLGVLAAEALVTAGVAVVVANLDVADDETAGPARGGDSTAADRSVYDGRRATAVFGDDPAVFAASLALTDGRRVRIWVPPAGDELREQHYSPDADAWTRPQVIYRPDRPDPCQGMQLVEGDGLVAAHAAFGMFCYAGEATARPLALVALGDLTVWQVHEGGPDTGWSELSVDGEEVRWSGSGRAVVWTPEQGFGEDPG